MCERITSAVFLVLAAGAAAGCLSSNFLQGPPRQNYKPASFDAPRVGGLTAQVDAATVTSGERGAAIKLVVEAAGTVLVRDAALSSAWAAPCVAGMAVNQVQLDDSPRWDRPLSLSGRHTLTLSFADAGDLLHHHGAVVDVQIAGAGVDSCLRVPLSGADETSVLEPTSRWTIGAVLRSSFPTGVGPYQWIDDELRIGYWTRHLLVAAEVGGTISGCVGCRGPNVQVPLWLLAEGIPLRIREFGLGVVAAYGVIYGIPKSAPDPIAWLHGPKLGIHVLRLTPSVWSTRGAQIAARGVEISLSYQRAAVGPVQPMLIIGLGLVKF